MGIATGEVFAFPEGKLYLYASASGTTSGSGVAWVNNATLSFEYNWVDSRVGSSGYDYVRHFTDQRATLSIAHMVGDLTTFRLANATAPVNAKFEGLVTGGRSQSAQFVLYSGSIDGFSVTQSDGNVFEGTLNYHTRNWSAFGG